MSDIEFKVESIGGHSGSHSERIKRGKLNLVGGSSASGKSSLVRGAQFALVGGVTKPGPIADEIENLHLDDSSSEGYGLIHAGTRSASAEVSTDTLKSTATISSSGAVSGIGNNMKAAYTTLLSSQPESILHAAVAKGGDDFSWVVDDLSEANNYLSWSNTLHRVKQEIQTKKTEFESWKNSSQDVDATIASLEAQSKELEERAQSLGKGGTEELENAQDEAGKSRALFSSANKDFQKARGEVTQKEAENRVAQDNKNRAGSALRNARRRIADIDDILEEGLQIRDTTNLDTQIASLNLDKATASGSNGGTWEIPEILDALSKSEVSGSGAKAVSAWEDTAREKLGDNAEMLRITAELSQLEGERRHIQNQDAKRRAAFADAKSTKADLKRQVADARQTIAAAEQAMPHNTQVLEERKSKLNIDEDEAKDAAEKVAFWESEVERLSNNPELTKVNNQIKSIADQTRDLLENKTSHFLLRYDSLGMMGSDTLELTEEQGGAHFTGIENSDMCLDLIIEKNIEAPDPRKEAILLDLLRNWKLSEAVNATVEYVDNKASEHREKAREIFNEVGSSIFSSLSFSPMTKMELNDSYELKITWADGRGVTGLSGSGGERTIVAAAMLIAMRAAYTPEIPVLMFDGVLGNLNEKARKELQTFLAGYAEATNIAVVATLLTDSSTLTVETF